MCGIAGWIDWERDLTDGEASRIVEGMAAALNHRGPDMQGQWQTAQAALAHRRLAIIDPLSPPQPLVHREEGCLYVLTYGGELYNFRALRRELEACGHRFRTNCDTEVLLHAYMEWGEECVQRFNGIFAFALWDETRQQVLLARDHLGIKPLYYAQRGSALLFASEIKGLLAHPLVKPEIDKEGLIDILSFGLCRVPGSGIYRNVHELLPGHLMLFTRERSRNHPYWSLRSMPHTEDVATTSEHLFSLLEEAVTSQLVSDVPIVSLLSGGIDSSSVTMLASQALRPEGKDLHTYTVDYADSAEHFQEGVIHSSIDLPWAQRASTYAGTLHHTIVIDTPELIQNLLSSLYARDFPGRGQIETSLYLLCQAIKQDASVAISGEASDEIFGSYPWYHEEEALSAPIFPWFTVMPRSQNSSQNLLIDWISSEALAYAPVIEHVSQRYQQAIAEVPVLVGEDERSARQRKVFYLNLTRFLPILLDRMDRMSMATGVEVRVPFCDARLIEYVWNIPWEMKMVDGLEKGILRRAVVGLIPDDIRLRRKSAYPISNNPSYQNALRVWVQDILADPNAPVLPFLNKKSLSLLLEDRSAELPIVFLYEYVILFNTWLSDYQISIC